MTMPAALRLTLALAFAYAATVQAEEFMHGSTHALAAAEVPGSTDCVGAGLSGDTGMARVIFHDGRSAPVSVPMNTRAGQGAGDGVTSSADAPVAAEGGGSASTPVRLPSAEPSAPPRSRQGMRWQTLVPGSLK